MYSRYCDDPSGKWLGYDFHEQRLREFLSNYNKVLLVGASMGASACLLFSHLADYVIAINPLVK